MLTLAQCHIARIGLKMATCSVPAVDDTMGALKAAKDAHAMAAEQGKREMMGGALDMMAQVLMYNGVPGSVIQTLSDPEEIFQDVMSGKFTTAMNAFPPKPQVKQYKIEELIPTSNQLNRSKFTWNNPIGGYTYTLIWQSVKERNIPNKKARGSYDILAVNQGAKTGAVTQAFTAMSNDAADRQQAMVVLINSHNGGANLGSAIMTQVGTLASMITARLSRVTAVQLNEGHYDWLNSAARTIHFYPVTLSLLRSCRLEAPNVTCGFVGGDAASWMADPAPLVENLFDTLESDECEVLYRRGESFGPLIVHRPMDDGIMYVKAKKKNLYSM